MYIHIDDDAVVNERGDEIRRGPHEFWAAYEAWVAAGGAASKRFTADQWNKLNDLSRSRLAPVGVAPDGASR